MNTEIWERLDVSFQREDQKEMMKKAERDAVQALQDVEEIIEKAARNAVQAQQEETRNLLAAELSKSKHESPPKGEDSK
jgi:hypothetical protein